MSLGALVQLIAWITQAVEHLKTLGTDCSQPISTAFRCGKCAGCERQDLVTDAQRWIGSP